MASQSAGIVRALVARARAASFDTWLFGLMLLFTSLAVAAGLYVSYTALRYVAEEIGGMPPAVSTAFPLTIDAAVAAGLLGEWWLSGRWRRERLATGYMFVFGLVFAAITVGGNALHGALALAVQRPIVLHIGGRLVPLPWWTAIAVSAVPGLAIAGAGTALSLVVGARRRELGHVNVDAPSAGSESQPELDSAEFRAQLASQLSAAIREMGLPMPALPMPALAHRPTPGLTAATAEVGPETEAGDRRWPDAATNGGQQAGPGPVTTVASSDADAGHDRDQASDRAVTSDDGAEARAMTAEEAREAVAGLVRLARRRGGRVDIRAIRRVTGRGERQARRLRDQAEKAVNPDSPARRSRVPSSSEAAPAAAPATEEA